MDKLNELSLEELASLQSEKREAITALFAVETPSDDDVAQAEALAADITAIEGEIAGRETAASARAEKFAALKEQFAAAEGEDDEDDEEGEEDEPEVEAAEEAEVEAAEETEVVASVKPRSTVRTLARKSQRPKAPEVAKPSAISITASADVPEFAAGQALDGLAEVAKAVTNRAKGFPKFNPARGGSADGKPQLHKFGVASLHIDYPEELTVKRGSDDFEIVSRAANEKRLEGESLVAAGGWCAPSETIYDLCDGETLDGILSVPEINVARGGINFTSGPDFADLYTDTGFLQTEAEAIANTEKECYEIECPPFSEVRLDAIGLCITVPILTDAAYPELTRRVVSGSIIAHQHRVNASVISRMVTASGAARVITGMGSTVSDSLEGLELLAEQRRQHYRLGLNQTLEVVVPFWVRSAFRSDIARRNGIAKEVVTDADIQAHFRARNLNVQFVYDWQPLAEDAEVYPATFNALLYPAGTFVKGVTDVINLSAVYDAASLKVNTYTGLFMEQGLLVAKTCYGSDLVTLPICNSGAQGALEITCGGSI